MEGILVALESMQSAANIFQGIVDQTNKSGTAGWAPEVSLSWHSLTKSFSNDIAEVRKLSLEARTHAIAWLTSEAKHTVDVCNKFAGGMRTAHQSWHSLVSDEAPLDDVHGGEGRQRRLAPTQELEEYLDACWPVPNHCPRLVREDALVRSGALDEEAVTAVCGWSDGEGLEGEPGDASPEVRADLLVDALVDLVEACL